MSELPKTIRNYIDAYNALNVEGMLECLAKNVEFQNISNGEVNAHTHSKEEFEKLARAGVTAFSSREQTVTQFMTVSSITLVEIEYKAVIAADLPNGWKAGQELDFSGASAFELDNDKIIKLIDQS